VCVGNNLGKLIYNITAANDVTENPIGTNS
jgi:hypothetical protein